MICVNLQQIGPVPPRFCTREELTMIMSTAAEILADTPEDVLDQILDEWETALAWTSQDLRPVSEEWYMRALLLTCIRGLRGEMRPQFYTIGRD